MILTTSGENITQKHGSPWASVALILLFAACYGTVILPLNKDYQQDRAQALAAFWTVAEAQFEAGNLANQFWVDLKTDPSIAGKKKNAEVFPPEITQAWDVYENQKHPVERVVGKGYPSALLTPITPATWWLGLLAALCLYYHGFLFEHLLDRLLAFGGFVLIGFVMLAAPQYLPPTYAPDPVFAWGYAVIAYLLMMLATAPTGRLDLNLRGWMGRSFSAPVTVPVFVFPVVFIIVYSAYMILGPYGANFNPVSLATPALVGGVFGVAGLVFGNREKAAEDPESLINQQISAAELLYGEERHEEAKILLFSLFDHGPHKEQLRRMITLAWQHDAQDLLVRAYNSLLSKTLATNDILNIQAIVEEMLGRNLQVPGRTLITILNTSIRNEQIRAAKRIVPHLMRAKDTEPDAVQGVLERLIPKVVDERTPDVAFLDLSLKWLQKHAPESGAVARIKHLKGSFAPQEAELNTHSGPIVQQFVSIELHRIGVSDIHLCIVDRKMQKVPWTAVRGVFGCHMQGGERGLRGCIVISFQRRTFGCIFNVDRIKVKNPYDGIMSFEDTWNKLSEQVPEDLPFTKMKDFEGIPDQGAFEAAVEKFLT